MKTLKLLLVLMMVCYVSLNPLYAQPPLQVTLAGTDPGCGLQNGSIQATITDGIAPYSFTWYDNSGVITNAPQNPTGLGVGRYTILVQDQTGYGVWQSIVLTSGVTASLSSTPETCSNSNGTATITFTGGTAPYNVLWEDGQTGYTATGLSQSFFTVTATDANGCEVYVNDSLGIYITNNTNVFVNVNTIQAQCSAANGSATAVPTGGVAPYTYYWATTPVQTTATATNLVQGQYSVRVTDATGCAGRATAFVGATSGTLQATSSITDEHCGDATGAISVTPTGGTAPYTYLWNNASTASSLTGLSKGWYNVKISDNGGCQFSKYLFVDNYSPVSLSFTTTPAACDHTSGSAIVTPAGGAAPYTYNWGWSSNSTSATISNVSDGSYVVLVTDANGCTRNDWIYVPLDANCINTISGKVFQDDNGNCIMDAGEYPVRSYVYNNVTPGYDRGEYTDGQGNYSITSGTGNYVVSAADVALNYTVVCPAGGQYAINGMAGQQSFTNKDFALQPIVQKQDVRVYGYAFGARPGFVHQYVVSYTNIGTSPASGTVTLKHDANETFQSATPSADSYNATTGEISFSYSNLGIGETQYFYVYVQLPPTTPLGTTLIGEATIANTGGDDNLADNSYQIQTVVVGSFDPNDIAVSPTGAGTPGYITRQQSELTYHIRFQNTGTAEAIFIKVVDTLDSDLQLNSVHDVVASHPYTLTIKDNGVLEFYFADINLPDSTTDLEGSNGFITYKVNQGNMLPMGTEITNNAYIFFDYNAPVKTNTVLNTVTTTAPVVDPSAAAARHKAYPVPAHDQLIIQSDVNYELVQLMDLTGKVVKSTTAGGNTYEMSVNDLAPGIYIYKIFVEGEATMTGKVVVE